MSTVNATVAPHPSSAASPGPTVAGRVVIRRELPHTPALVYAAWSRREALQRWGHPGQGWWLEFDRFAFRVGQSDLCRFGPVGETGFVNENSYLAIEPHKRIVYASTLRSASGGRLSFAGVVAIDIEPQAGGGCVLHFHEQGLYFDDKDDEAGHQAGWSQMLQQLERYLSEQPQPRHQRRRA
jgi:uncharacterized protein YndB with AHSA1/START domain